VFIYTSDDVRNPTTTTRNGTTSLTQQSSVWTELLNTTPTGTTFTGLTAAGQSFVDPAGGPTITLMSISAAGAVVQVTNPMNTNPPTCLDGTTPPTSGSAMGSTACGPVTTSDGGVIGTGGAPGTGGTSGGMGGRGMGGTAGGMGGMTGGGMGGMTTTGTGGMTTTGTGGSTGAAGNGGPSGSGGSTTGAGGSKGSGEGPGAGVTGGCNCSVPSSNAPGWASIFGVVAVGLLRRRRRGIR
jgi:MYXO-CTERM domain-containing protein